MTAKTHARRRLKQALRSLPTAAPTGVLSRETRAAIDRRARALALDTFERNRQTLETWLLRQPDVGNEEAALRYIQNLELDNGQHVMVSVRDLWGLTARLGTLEPLITVAKAAILVLERATGRTWYPHRDVGCPYPAPTDPAECGVFCGLEVKPVAHWGVAPSSGGTKRRDKTRKGALGPFRVSV
jgi:hypothetical protein